MPKQRRKSETRGPCPGSGLGSKSVFGMAFSMRKRASRHASQGVGRNDVKVDGRGLDYLVQWSPKRSPASIRFTEAMCDRENGVWKDTRSAERSGTGCGRCPCLQQPTQITGPTLSAKSIRAIGSVVFGLTRTIFCQPWTNDSLEFTMTTAKRCRMPTRQNIGRECRSFQASMRTVRLLPWTERSARTTRALTARSLWARETVVPLTDLQSAGSNELRLIDDYSSGSRRSLRR